MAEAVVNQDTEIITKGPGVVNQASSLVSQVQRMYSQPAFQRSLPTMVALIVGIVGIAAYLYMQKPNRTTLYAGLPESEKSLVLDALKNAGVDVSMDPVTGEVLVPVVDYHSARMTLAAQGLPHHQAPAMTSSINSKSSRSVEAAKLKQTQEMELARLNMRLSWYGCVHLAIPEKRCLCVTLRSQQHRCFCTGARPRPAVVRLRPLYTSLIFSS